MARLIVDTETQGLCPELGQIAFAAGVADADSTENKVTIYNLRDRDDVVQFMARLRDASTIIAHHAKFDLRQLIRTLNLPLGFFDSKQIIDTQIMAKHVLAHHVNEGGFGLKALTHTMDSALPQYFDPKKWLRKAIPLPKIKRGADGVIENEEERAQARANRTNFSLLPPEVLVPYLSADIYRTWALFKQCSRLMETASSEARANYDVETALVKPVLGTELKGIPISGPNMDQVELAMEVQFAEVKRSLPFDFLSRTALLEHFGEVLKDHKDFKTERGDVSCDRDALTFLASRSIPWAAEVIQARHYHKILTTYLKTWRRFLPLGRLFPSYNIVGPRTGRMSSDNPNIQNVEKKLMRRIIVPEEGHVLVLADFSQMELRAAAHMSMDKQLLKALDGDVHTETAKFLFRNELPSIEERKIAKTLNFAVLYGARPKKIRRTLTLESKRLWKLQEAQEIYERFWELYPGFAAWAASIQRFAGQRVALADPFGRRQFPDIYRPYALTNYLIQGFCAGVFKRGLLRAFRAGLDGRLFVHDEIGVMARPDDAVEVGRALKVAMEDVDGFRFPVEVSLCRANWFEKQPLEV